MKPNHRIQKLLCGAAISSFLVLAACVATTPQGSQQQNSSSTTQSEVVAGASADFSRSREPKAKRMPAPSKTLAPVGIMPSYEDRENYAEYSDNPIHQVTEKPVSTFSVDVDTGSYANMRRFVQEGQMPPTDAVRVEEMINYFDYAYATPDDPDQPFSVTTEVAPSPWNAKTKLLHIGIKAYDIERGERPPANLVFLVDVSGSMQSRDKLPLLQSSLRLLVNQMGAEDRISLVTYAGNTQVVLEATSGSEKAKIRDAINALSAGGSTNGGAGIKLAYAEAQKGFIEGGINRILLATDGDLNVGMTEVSSLEKLVEDKREAGVSLSVLGFGTGNYNDHLLEQVADHGNGNYAYIDTLSEAKKVLVDEISSTLFTVAKDVKLQVEFNPAIVSEYRLVGYENRALKREDFNNDKVDAGEIGAGHTVTAIYEVALVGEGGASVDPLRYSDPAVLTASQKEMAFVKIRYKEPDASRSQLLQYPILKADIKQDIDQTEDRFRFSAAVAAFGQHLRGGKYTGEISLKEIRQLAKNSMGPDPHGYRREFIELLELADELKLAQK